MKLVSVAFVNKRKWHRFTLHSRTIEGDKKEFYCTIDDWHKSGMYVQPLDTLNSCARYFADCVVYDLSRYLKYILLHNPCKIYK